MPGRNEMVHPATQVLTSLFVTPQGVLCFQGELVPRGGAPPLVPIWPAARVIERNPYPFFPFNPRWQTQMTREELEVFCALLKLAWISDRPCFLPPERESLVALLCGANRPHRITDLVFRQFQHQKHTGLLFFPPQLRALRRLVSGEDMYSLLWDESL